MEQTALVVHGHFYQPPRENPWTGRIEEQPGARPFHDWNERIHSECYRPNAHGRITDAEGRVAAVVNNYARINFNFGPTLLSWLERQHPETYLRILAADAESLQSRGGHGNAIAQGYHHTILPLASERDRRTEIRWGLADFRHRYGREPESLWLPETAADAATLAALIEEGLRYVILSPFQAGRVRRVGREEWEEIGDGQVDATVPYLFRHPDGSERSIAVFFYDGEAARAVAFGGALASSRTLVEHFERAARAGGGPLASVATDGESYGHHYKFGDLCLAHALDREAPRRGFRPTNYGEFLEHNPPAWEVELKAGPEGEGTAWSCAHGLGRWSRDCGCHLGAPAGWTQKWRAPLRRALNFLRDEAARVYETVGGELFRDPWATRDRYVELLLDPARDRAEFFGEQRGRALSVEEQARALTLLEMQRGSLMTFTSCGWFFDDISGIETVQVLRYAARTLELLENLGVAAPRAGFLELLAEAESNVGGAGNGADIFRAQAESARPTLLGALDSAREAARGSARAAAGYALLLALEGEPTTAAFDAALKILEEVANLDPVLERTRVREQAEKLLEAVVEGAGESRPEETVSRVSALVRLTSALGFEDFFERAQELVYAAIRRGPPETAARLGELALSLKLSPEIIEKSETERTEGSGLHEPALS